MGSHQGPNWHQLDIPPRRKYGVIRGEARRELDLRYIGRKTEREENINTSIKIETYEIQRKSCLTWMPFHEDITLMLKQRKSGRRKDTREAVVRVVSQWPSPTHMLPLDSTWHPNTVTASNCHKVQQSLCEIIPSGQTSIIIFMILELRKVTDEVSKLNKAIKMHRVKPSLLVGSKLERVELTTTVTLHALVFQLFNRD